MRNRSTDRRTFPAVRLPEEHNSVVVRGKALDDVRGAVGRAVVHDDDLRVESERVDPVEHFADRRGFVVGGDQEGNAHGAGG